MVKPTKADDLITQELDELIAKSPPYSATTLELGSTTLHYFVRGLILSTNIIEVIDKHLPNGYRVDWGQVIDEKDGNTLSRECDIIIYKEKPYKTIENKYIRFVLVDKNQARIVIQVKTNIQSVTDEIKDYCKELKKFVPQVWFIAERCWAGNIKRLSTIEQQLKEAGYKQFFYLYRMDDNTLNRKIEQIDYKRFIKFINLIKRIKLG